MNRKERAIDKSELSRIEDRIYQIDFSQSVDSEAMRKRILKESEEKRGVYMRKHLSFKKIATIIAAAVLGSCLMLQTTFGQEVVAKVLKRFTITGSTYEQMNPKAVVEPVELPDSLKGKVFTKDGKEITVITEDTEGFCDKDGNPITGFDPETGEIWTEKDLNEIIDGMLVERDIHKINDHICFKAKIPAYVPEGYKFDRFQYFKKDESSPTNGMYGYLYYVNEETGKDILIMENYDCYMTRGTLTTDSVIEKIDINGVEAMLVGGTVDWVEDGVGIFYVGKGIETEELINSASSMKDIQ